MNNRLVSALIILGLGISASMVPYANAITVLDFEGLQSLENVNDFYNGGTGSLGSGGANHGVNFSSNSLALRESHPEANFTNPPSAETILFFLSGGADTMNVTAGFKDGFSFFYSSTSFAGSVIVYDGLNATGNVLASLDLSALGACTGADPFCNWAPFGVTFSGTAKSVDFAGVANQIGFDNITLGSDKPGTTPGTGAVPETGFIMLLGIGLAGVVATGYFSKVRTHSC